MWSSVRWYQPDGRFGGDIGRGGEGPGEYQAVTGMDVDDRGRVHVLDPANGGRVTVFRPAGEGYAYETNHRPDTYAFDICAAGDRRYLLTSRVTPDDERMIREIAGDGTTVRAFAGPFEPEPELARQFGPGQPTWILNGGPLLCSAELGLVVYGALHMGEVRAYTLDGALAWRVQLPDFHRVDFRKVERLGACCRYGPNPRTGTTHSIESMAFRGVGELLVTLVESGRAMPRRRYETRVLRVRDGVQVGVERHDMVVSAVWRGRSIGFSEDPYPRVIVR